MRRGGVSLREVGVGAGAGASCSVRGTATASLNGMRDTVAARFVGRGARSAFIFFFSIGACRIGCTCGGMWEASRANAAAGRTSLDVPPAAPFGRRVSYAGGP